MKNANYLRKNETGGPALAWSLLAPVMLLVISTDLLREGRISMAKPAAAAESDKPAPQPTTPPARDPAIAVEEEYQIARQKGTAPALELFIERHPDSPLAEKARADLRRLSR